MSASTRWLACVMTAHANTPNPVDADAKALVRVKAHRAELERLPTVFLSVSLSAAEDTDAARMAAQSCVDEFCEQAGWAPGRTERIAGCLQYREYDVFTRQLMRLLMKRMGHETDASHDYDYTDWDAVDRLGREIAQLAGSPTAARS